MTPRHELAADVAALLATLPQRTGPRPTPAEQRADFRHFVEMVQGPQPDFPGTIVDETVNSVAGEVRIRRYSPMIPTREGVFVYLHGGGWVLGDLDTHDRFPRATAGRLGVEVVSVDYRLAPEHPYPAALQDCLAVVDHLAPHSAWIGLCGDSAGANLAAAVAARRATTAPVDATVLIYPGLDVPAADPDPSLDGYGLDTADINYFWNAYRADNELTPDLAPLLAPEPLVAPPTLVSTAGFDPLRRDGATYVSRLAGADVAVTYLPLPHLVHGWLELADAVDSAARARDRLIDAMGTLHDATATARPSARP